MNGGILLQALGVIRPKSVVYRKFLGNMTNTSGVRVPSYDTPITIENASVQPVSTRIYQQLGLDLMKEYRRIFIPTQAVALEGQLSSDIFEFDGKIWKSIGNTAWFTYDGWNELILAGDKDR